MLYNPKWEQKIKPDPFTLESLIAWLEKQPPDSEYQYMDCFGGCLYGQYMAASGITWNEASPHPRLDDPHRYFRGEVYGIACRTAGPSTFGAALERARAALTKGSKTSGEMPALLTSAKRRSDDQR